MRIPRVYLPGPLACGATVTLSGKAAHHVIHVLRLRVGTAVQVFDGQGSEHLATLKATGRGEASIEIGVPAAPAAEPSLAIELAQGIARNDRMDFILQKAVELGAGIIQPLWMQRSQSRVKGERLEKRLQHWQGVVVSACEQSGRATLPGLSPPVDYAVWVQACPEGDMQLMLQPDSEFCLREMAAPAGRVTLLVGPEGGMTLDEQALARRAGFTGTRLGPRILRTETAALAALAGIQSLWGDFS
ncbi:MAG: 16S rRNA (uracil(1498)-N(3))-methyltransferase [Gammaproteobacteria bacterium]